MRLLFFVVGFLYSSVLFSQRTISHLPDIPGYQTLKGDFHIHTSFSDGVVWPTFRVDEAVREGLDVIAITDHIEYRPHKDYIDTTHNASYRIALPYARERNILLISGVEVTRAMPTGHFNALFVQDVDKLTDPNFMNVMEEANRQGAFVFWNHPGWKSQQPDGVPKLHDVHLELLKRGWLHGIEFYNTKCAYGFVLDWCNERNLTVMSNSDVHIAASDYWEFNKGGKRPVTLVFVKERSETGVKDALVEGRTLALYSGDSLAGKSEWADAFFKSSIEIKAPHFQNDEKYSFEIVNRSSLPYYLENLNVESELKKITLYPESATLVSLKKTGSVDQNFRVRNILVGDRKNLEVTLSFPGPTSLK